MDVNKFRQTYNEAGKELNKKRRDVLNKQCPLNHFKNCRRECQSYFEGTISEHGESCIINDPCCCNAFVTGIITHEE